MRAYYHNSIIIRRLMQSLPVLPVAAPLQYKIGHGYMLVRPPQNAALALAVPQLPGGGGGITPMAPAG